MVIKMFFYNEAQPTGVIVLVMNTDSSHWGQLYIELGKLMCTVNDAKQSASVINRNDH